MSEVTNEAELYDACRVLFGTEIKVDRNFLEYIQPSGVKSAYRKMALLTHPDRVEALGKDYLRNLNVDFRSVAEAYEKLSKYLKLRENGYQLRGIYTSTAANYNSSSWQPKERTGSTASASGSGSQYGSAWQNKNSQYSRHGGGATSSASSEKYSWNTKATGDRFTLGSKNTGHCTGQTQQQQTNLPRRVLRIGEYLYYNGLVSWKDLIAAIVWQTKQRHRVGEIASRWGWLSEDKVAELVRARNKGEKIGEALVRLKIITPFQCNMLLWQQQKSQKPIGEYFLQERLLKDNDLSKYLKFLKDHNSNFK
ncbi:J domain-containing protein [Candidatus Magnetomonas plexicatena]|uniref:J domain-containing protein n=1 Tax=Candidatus Magnetomonas plexicatena TaxID=2552947 RepID=UPI001C77B399|nr:hypothetical protein E2O03_005955 [Nitrospirales bacterium LBB_01]